MKHLSLTTTLLAAMAMGAFAGPITFDTATDAVDPATELAVLVNVANDTGGDISIGSWYVALEVEGAFLFLPGYTATPSALAGNFELPAGVNVSNIEIERFVAPELDKPLELTWHTAALDPAGNLVGEMHSWPVTLKSTFPTTPLPTPTNSPIPTPTPDLGIEWTRLLGEDGDDRGESVAVDAVGNVYVTGFVKSDQFRGAPVNGFGDGTLAKYDPAGNLLWTRLFGGNASDWPQDLAVAANGDVIVSGFTTSDDFEGITIKGGKDGFLMRWSPSGTLLWASLTNQSGSDNIYSIAIDAAGGIRALHGTDSGMLSMQSYDGSGNLLWTQSMPGTFTGASSHIAVDSQGNTVVPYVAQANTSTGAATFVAKVSATGEVLWTFTFYDYRRLFRAVAIDAQDNIYVGGTDRVNFYDESASDQYFDRLSVYKLDLNGVVLWDLIRPGTTMTFDRAESMAIDANGDLVIAGEYGESLNGSNSTAGSRRSTLILRLDANGNELSERIIQSPGTTWRDGHLHARSLAIGPMGMLHVAGHTQAATLHGQTGSGNFDFFTMKLQP